MSPPLQFIIHMEHEFVHKVYDEIAKEFDKTRYSVWTCVKRFLNGFPSNAIVGEWGMGNGKNMLYRTDLNMFGLDTCRAFVEIAQSKQLSVLQGNCLNPPFKNNAFDGIICIAVLHHVSNKADRVLFLDKLLECLKPNGKALITVWAQEQTIKKTWEDMGNGDYIIPWNLHLSNTKQGRYYHLFSKKEIEDLLSGAIDKFDVLELFYEMDNWCIILQKHSYTTP